MVCMTADDLGRVMHLGQLSASSSRRQANAQGTVVTGGSVLAFELTLQISRRVTLRPHLTHSRSRNINRRTELELPDTWLDPGIDKCFQNHQKPGPRT